MNQQKYKTQLRKLRDAKEEIEHVHFEDTKKIVMRTRVLNELAKLIMECKEEEE